MIAALTHASARARFAEAARPGVILLDHEGYRPATEGCRADVVVLAYRADEPTHPNPFIVWSMVMPPDEKAFLVSGGYHPDLRSALQDYDERLSWRRRFR